MSDRDMIVVGASAGGLAALKKMVKSLPDDFKGSICIVQHVPEYSTSHLPEILSKTGPLKAVHPSDGEDIVAGKIYVAPNGFHLILEEKKVLVKKGPKENRFRPSIDALFRSAAYVFKQRAIGIILSGYLDDGVSGLWNMKQQGGVVIVQSPQDAEQPQLPLNALQCVEADFVLLALDIAPVLAGLVKEAAPEKFQLSKEELKRLKMEVVIAMRDNSFEMGIMDMGELTQYTCPECNGALIRLVEDKIIRFRCHTGHAYTASSLVAEVSESIESLLWKSMRGMEEMNLLLDHIGKHYETLNNAEAAALFRAKAKESAERARIIHESVFRQEQYSEDIRFNKP